MGTLILLNDVSTEADENGLLLGSANPIASKLGNEQAKKIVDYFYTKISEVDLLAISDADRLMKLVHGLRAKSKDQILTKSNPIRFTWLRERNFGVLNYTQQSYNSDLFSNTRIAADDGESICQCRIRAINGIQEFCKNNLYKRIVMVSHSLVCQIIFNSILQKDHVVLTDFWLNKGSFVVFDFTEGKYGIKWKFINAYNALEDRSYTEKEIYSRLFGIKRSPASKAP